MFQKTNAYQCLRYNSAGDQYHMRIIDFLSSDGILFALIAVKSAMANEHEGNYMAIRKKHRAVKKSTKDEPEKKVVKKSGTTCVRG
jgi:hypothetical protein